ncbi:hypothetical protein FB451DRAFT_1280116 [Mycena latifolia]|nr:hypothetical protein FB451DRAFT_1280116 [Mycena latifolia]
MALTQSSLYSPSLGPCSATAQTTCNTAAHMIIMMLTLCLRRRAVLDSGVRRLCEAKRRPCAALLQTLSSRSASRLDAGGGPRAHCSVPGEHLTTSLSTPADDLREMKQPVTLKTTFHLAPRAEDCGGQAARALRAHACDLRHWLLRANPDDALPRSRRHERGRAVSPRGASWARRRPRSVLGAQAAVPSPAEDLLL